MKNRDLIGALFWIVFGAIFAVGACEYKLFKSGIPGPGFLPFMVAVCLIVLSVDVLTRTFSKANGEGDTAVGGRIFPEKNSLRRLSSALLSLFFYAVCLKYLGYILTTFLFMIVVLKSIEPVKWKITLIFSALITGLSYALFTILQVELPRGMLGI